MQSEVEARPMEDQIKPLLRSLMDKWRLSEEEWERSEESWKEKERQWLLEEGRIGEPAPDENWLWTRAELKWLRSEEEYQADNTTWAAMETVLDSPDESVHVFTDLLEFQVRYENRRRHWENRKMQWSQKQAWFAGRAHLLRESRTMVQTQTSETQTPEIQTPEIQTSEIQTPETQTPEIQTPEIQTSEIQTPETHTQTDLAENEVREQRLKVAQQENSSRKAELTDLLSTVSTLCENELLLEEQEMIWKSLLEDLKQKLATCEEQLKIAQGQLWVQNEDWVRLTKELKQETHLRQALEEANEKRERIWTKRQEDWEHDKKLLETKVTEFQQKTETPEVRTQTPEVQKLVDCEAQLKEWVQKERDWLTKEERYNTNEALLQALRAELSQENKALKVKYNKLRLTLWKVKEEDFKTADRRVQEEWTGLTQEYEELVSSLRQMQQETREVRHAWQERNDQALLRQIVSENNVSRAGDRLF